MANASGQLDDTAGLDKEELPDSETKPKLDTALKVLQTCSDFSSEESFQAFERITVESIDESTRRVRADYLAGVGYADIYVSVMKWLQKQKTKPTEGEEGTPDFKFVAEMFGGYWNFTDGSPLLCQRFGQCGIIELLFQDLHDIDVAIMAVKQLKKERKKHHLFAKLGILHNCIRLHKDNRPIYRKANAFQLLTNFVQGQHVAVYVKTICLLILAYIVDETESEKLAINSTGGCVNFLISLLRKALSAENQRYGGFTAFELLEGINNLAMNDGNKVKTVQGGCLCLVTMMMGDGRNEEEQLLAAKTVWRLSFAPANKKIIREDAAVMKALDRLQTSPYQSVRRASSGALWEIREGKISVPSTPSNKMAPAGTVKGRAAATTGDLEHIMISYQWDVQERMIQLKDLLISQGFRVWMDIEKMEGNILAAMADAVEKAAVVLICVSQKYKDSESCRTEASYAYKKKRSIIPLMMEEDYEPDGWLGALIGVKLYYLMHSDDLVHQKLPSLIQELGVRGRGHSSHDSVDGSVIPSNAPVPDTSPPPVSPATPKTSALDTWTVGQFQAWLKDIGMDKSVGEQLAYCDGKHITQMYRQYKSSPEYFHSSLRTDLKMDFHAVLKFTTALHQLFNQQY